jgi:hypothetical protein
MTQKARKRLLVDARFQLAFTGYFLLTALLAICVLYCANAYFLWRLAHGNGELFYAMNVVFLITSLGAIGILGFGGVVLSHKVAGPLARLRRHMRKVAKGEHSGPVVFRDGDFFGELADAYNAQLTSRGDSPGRKAS